MYMLYIAGQTAGPIGLIFFRGHSWVKKKCKKDDHRNMDLRFKSFGEF